MGISINITCQIGQVNNSLISIVRLKYGNHQKKVTPEDLAEWGITMKPSREITLESEYDKMKKMDIDNWVQVRGPRPWEENETQNKIH